MSRPTTAMVLAAGMGVRMRPLTDSRPKPLVPLAGVALLDRVLDRLADAGFERAVVNVHYLADQIEHHLAERDRPAIVISDERAQILDTGGGVVKALRELGPDPFLVHNSDSVWIENARSVLATMIDRWDCEAMDALLLLAPVSSAVGYDGSGDFFMNGKGRLARRTPGEPAPYVFAGVSITHPRLLKGAPSGPFSLNDPWDRAIEAGRLHGVELDGVWMHVGTPEALLKAESILKDGDV